MNADKFETESYIKMQAKATQRAYNEIINKSRNPSNFFNAINIYVDTTNMNEAEVFEFLLKKLKSKQMI